jgi:hypothetical protein
LESQGQPDTKSRGNRDSNAETVVEDVKETETAEDKSPVRTEKESCQRGERGREARMGKKKKSNRVNKSRAEFWTGKQASQIILKSFE